MVGCEAEPDLGFLRITRYAEVDDHMRRGGRRRPPALKRITGAWLIRMAAARVLLGARAEYGRPGSRNSWLRRLSNPQPGSSTRPEVATPISAAAVHRPAAQPHHPRKALPLREGRDERLLSIAIGLTIPAADNCRTR